MRGGVPRRWITRIALRLVSPHAWGWAVIKQIELVRAVGFPTCVGVGLSTNALHLPVSWFPHMRGGGPRHF